MTLEQTIQKKIRSQRLLFGCLTGALAVLTLVFLFLYTGSARVERLGSGIFAYEKVVYEVGYGLAAALCLIPTAFVGCLWFGTAFRRCVKSDCGGDTILVHRGMLHTRLYINEREADSRGPVTLKYYLEGKLSDGTTVTVALGKYWAVRLMFSSGRSPVEL